MTPGTADGKGGRKGAAERPTLPRGARLGAPRRLSPLLLPLAALLLAACSTRGAASVAGIASWRGMGVEGVSLRAVAEGGVASAAVEGRTTYHGAFVLSLPPGRWRIEGSGSLPAGGATRRLRGEALVEVTAGVARIDRVPLLLAEEGEGRDG